MAIDPKLLEQILGSVFGGIGGENGISPYQQEQPQDMSGGLLKPIGGAMQPTTPSQSAMARTQISPMLGLRNQAQADLAPVNGQPQFNSREALDSYGGTNFAGMNRNADEGIQSYVQRLIGQPTGAGQLSDKFMQSWQDANKMKNREEPIAAKAVDNSGGFGGNSVPAMEGFNGMIAREDTPLRIAQTPSPAVEYAGGTVADRGPSGKVSDQIYSPPTKEVKNNPFFSFFQTSNEPDPNAQPTEEERMRLAMMAGFNPYYGR